MRSGDKELQGKQENRRTAPWGQEGDIYTRSSQNDRSTRLAKKVETKLRQLLLAYRRVARSCKTSGADDLAGRPEIGKRRFLVNFRRGARRTLRSCQIKETHGNSGNDALQLRGEREEAAFLGHPDRDTGSEARGAGQRDRKCRHLA